MRATGTLVRASLFLPLVLGACATAAVRGEAWLGEYVRDFEAAAEAREVELPTRARTLADIRLLNRAHEVAAACVPGRNPAYTADWLAYNRERRMSTASGAHTIGWMAKHCERALHELEHRAVEACGARYVQLERHREDDDAWSVPRITRVSDGWYMTPCDRPPGAAPKGELKDAEGPIRAACGDDSDEANLYLLARWTDNPNGAGKVATVACLLPRRERSDWLSGNPALGVK